MKTDLKTKAEKEPPKLKARKGVRRAASKSASPNGKHPLATFEHAPIGIVESSLEGKHIQVNEEFCRILGYEKAELLQGSIKAFTHEEDYHIDVKLHQQLVEGKIPFYKLEKRYIRKDDEMVWAELTRSLVRDEEGKPLYTIGVVLDISERKQVERVLRESVERLRLATEAARMFTWEWDFQKQMYTLADSFTQVLGFSAGLLPKNSIETLESLSPAEDLQVLLGAFAKAIENQRDLHSLQCRVIDPENGQIAWLEISAKIVYDHAGNPERMFGVAQNITDSKQKEEKLRESEEKYSTLFNSIDEGFCILEKVERKANEPLDFRYIVANPAFATQAGVADVVGKTIRQAFPGEREEWFETYDTILRTGEALSFQRDLPTQGRVLELYAFRVADKTRRHVAVIFKDITQRIQAEAALRQSEERFAQFMQHLPGLAWIKDVQGRYVYANAAAEQAFSTPREKLYGKTDQDVFPPEFADQFKQNDERALLDAKGVQVIETLEHADGVLHHSLVSKFPIPGPDGNTALIGGTAFDITERKQAEEALHQLNLQLESRVQKRTAKIQAINQSLRDEIAERKKAEEALRKSEATARLLLNTAPDGVVIIDDVGVIVHANLQIADLFGYQPDDVLGKQIEVLIPERFLGQHRQHRDSYKDERLKRAMGMGMDLFGRRKNGNEFPVDIMLTPISNIPGWDVMVTVRDDSERKEMERALRKSHERLQILSQRLVEVQEEERRALARELHDRVGQTLAALNINLIIINGQLSADAAREVGTRLNDSMKLVAETIALVRDVMTDLRPAVLDDYGLEAALESHLDEFMSRYEIKAKLEKAERPMPRLGPSIEMTFLRIAQEALMNIARHAQADHVHLALRQDVDSVSLIVQDNGTGIESWQEANRPGSHGLTIMRERAEAFGGTLHVRSKPGQGTKVEVSIPVKGQNEVRQEKH